MATKNYGIYATANGATDENWAGYFQGDVNITGSLTVAGTESWVNTGGDTMTGKLTTAASALGGAGLTLPHGLAPTTLANGDLWTTTGGLYARISGTTVGPITGAGSDHGTLSGLADDDHPQYFNLSQSETVAGIPAFNGGSTGVSAPFTVDSTFLVASLNADLLDGNEAAAFATSGHAHSNLTAGNGLTGGPYNGGAVATFNVVGGSGISVAADAVSLGPLTADWNQTGAFDITLNNADSQMRLLESTGATYFGTLDVGDLSANATYTFSGASGTVLTTGNDGAGSTLDADLLDGLHASAFMSSGTSHGDLSGLADDDHPQYFSLSQNETVTGIPAFNGGINGTSAPFTVDSYTTVTNLSADYLDGYSEAAFFRLANNETVTGVPAFNGGTASAAPFSVDSSFLVTNLNADLLDGQHASAFGDGYSLNASDGDPTDALYVDAGGEVGIGTVAPSALLDVQVDSTNFARFGSSTSSYLANFRHTEDPADGTPQATIYAYRTRTAQNDGVSYTTGGTNKAIMGYNEYGDAYTFGVTGFVNNLLKRSGGVLGATTGGFWGALGYMSSAPLLYGGYFTSTGSGTGFQANRQGIGVGSYGNLMGGWMRGEEYGLYTSGKRFGSFTNGNGFTTGYHAFVQGDTGGKSITYSVASPSVDVMIHGTAKLAAGETMVPFPPEYSELFSDTAPITIFVSPVGPTAPLFVSTSSSRGFEVGATDGRATEAQFAWMAIGTRKGYENVEVPSEVLAADFEANMERVAFNENDLQGSGLGMHFDDSLHFGAIPESAREESGEGSDPSFSAREAASESREAMGGIPARPTASPSRTRPGTNTPKNPVGSSDGRPSVPPAPGQALFNAKEAVETGDVLVLNPANGDELYRCQRPSDPMVVGISGADAKALGEVPVFQYGTAWVRVDAQYGSIARGDLLTASATPGHAMRAVSPALGTVLGKALEPIETGTGLIKVLVMLR